MSRLLNNSTRIRNNLESRNLYTPDDPYDANASNTVETINSIVNIVSPFTSFDLSNSIAGRLVGNNTPLAQIGLRMLAKQFVATAASNAAAEFLPAIKFENLFDGDPNTKFLSVQVDFQITRRENQTNAGKILEAITGNYPKKGNPFGQNSTNLDYVKNSGKGQLQLMVKSLNANKYKPSSQSFKSTIISEGFKYGSLVGTDISQFFPDNDNIFYPYNQYKISKIVNINAINTKLNTEINTYRKSTESQDNYLEYGASQEFVDALGVTKKYNNNNGSGDYNFEDTAENNYGLDDDVRNKLVWGRDGVDNNYNNDRSGFDDPIKNSVEPNQSGEFVTKTSRFDFTNNEDAFNMDAGGLLSYTRELLNSQGKYGMFDVTKKKFIDKDEQLHFNGSPLRKHNDGKIDKSRQHSVVDPYDTYVKAIRYNGNKIYNGNENSVIYNSVIPQVVPTIGGSMNKNLMFSIENLAVVVNADSTNPKVAFVEDDFGTVLPICERGPNGGRLMWFPPYDINISENVTVNRTSTSFLGRGEPIYTYNNTERMANLSFKLIIDYPPQVKGLNHVQAARFFAFGGEADSPKPDSSEKIKQREDLIEERDSIQPTKELSNPQIESQTINFYFANDQPKTTGQWDIQTHIDKKYELGNSAIDGNDYGLNESFNSNIERIINELLVDDTKQPFIEIYIEGSASQLYSGTTVSNAEYNKRLSERRVASIREYIENKYKSITGKALKNDRKPVFTTVAIGQTGGTATDEASEIRSLAAKQARRAYVEFRYNGLKDEVETPISEKEQEDLITLNEQISALDTEISAIENGSGNITECGFNSYTIEDGILKGFSSTENNKYKPAFHSQTPEDFHRRLTFLHQCTRQGQAVRKKRGDNNSFSANNSVFGRQPVQILRIGDMFHTKIFIDSMQIDYSDAPWDMNPEGMGMQFMIADVKLALKLVGGESLKGPINALQNAVSYNYYANSTFYNDGVYKTATAMENLQYSPQDSDSTNSVKPSSETPAQNEKTNKIPNE